MNTFVRVACAGLLATVALTDLAVAQYYPPPPPPPPYGGPPPGYYPPPPPRRFGGRCDSSFRTPYGRERLVCALYEPKPLGYECHCPAPPPPPGYSPGPDPRGRVIP